MCRIIKKNYSVVIVDNLINSEKKVLGKIKKLSSCKPFFYEIDITKKNNLEKIFSLHDISGIIHFAGLKEVGESFEKPLFYYYNNIVGTLNLLELSLKYKVKKFVFSSSATVYGNNKVPHKEDMALGVTTNPYGETKKIIERVINDFISANEDYSATILRYFNPIGAHPSGLLGESPLGIPNNLMPYLLKVAKGDLACLSVYGNDYDTIDGTGIRDYIHVMDLARGHIAALEKIKKGVSVYNLGTGSGTSVLELINLFEKVNGIKVKYEIVGRRAGDIVTSYADVKKIKKELNFKTNFTLEDMVRDSWEYGKRN